jgi:acetyltransferase-like isoleucine patch superfamily enzyme
LPGALGLAFRKLFWPGLFAHAGRGSVWGRNVVVRHPGKIRIGDGVVIDDGCYLDAKGSEAGEFRIGDRAIIGRNCIVSSKGGSVVIEDRVNIGGACALYSSGGIRIGADTMFAAHCYVGGGRYDPYGRLEIPMCQQELPARGVVIEEDCWLGAGAAVIDGVRVGKGSVIAAGAVVTRDVHPYSVVAGVPAKLVGKRTPPSD